MKNKLITLALIFLSATFMASCHPPRDAYPDDPPYLESALKATFGLNASGVTSVEFSEAGRYVVTFFGTEETPPDVLCGKYYIEDGLYVMEELGSAEVSKDTVRLNIRTWPYQDSFTLPADIDYNCRKRETKLPATAAVCRTWTVDNRDIKKMIRLAGIDRMVTTLNSLTREEEKHPIWEVASSHMARRVLIGNLYKEIKDPNLIAKISGHVENSTAFNRYRDIDDDLAKETILKLE